MLRTDALHIGDDGPAESFEDISGTPRLFRAAIRDDATFNGASKVHADDEWGAAVNRTGNELMVFNFDSADSVNRLASFTHEDIDNAEGVWVDGYTVYIASGNNDKLLSIDTLNPSEMAVLDSIDLSIEGPTEIVQSGDYLYVVGDSPGPTAVVDASNPEDMSEVTTISDVRGSSNARTAGADIVDDILYVAGVEFWTIDISNPEEPVVLDSTTGPIASRYTSIYVEPDLDVAVVGEELDDAIILFDISDPSDIQVIDHHIFQDEVYGVHGFRDTDIIDLPGQTIIAIAYDSNTVAFWDIDDPEEAEEVTSLTSSSNLDDPRWVYIENGYVLVPCDGGDDQVTVIG